MLDLLSPSTSPEGLPLEEPLTPAEIFLPNQLKYYNDDLSKAQFNLLHVNGMLKMLALLYPALDEAAMRFFIVEVLRRSKSLVQTMQICSFYLFRLVNKEVPACPRKLVLGMLILLLKFCQDHNYSFKTWLKICGCQGDELTLTLAKLRETERQCLQLLDYDLYINGAKYESWCNLFAIFAYDFISVHRVALGAILWCGANETAYKLRRWRVFLARLDSKLLAAARVNFRQYYANQIGVKILMGPKAKRVIEPEPVSKRLCVR